jgi:ketosteroid isomerase-like protein
LGGQKKMLNKILKLEEEIVQAIIESDVILLDKLLHEDLVFVNHLGMTVSKKEDLAPHYKGDLKVASIQLSDRDVRFFGDTAIVTVSKNIRGSYSGQEFESHVKFTRVWWQVDGQWKVIAASSVPLQI